MIKHYFSILLLQIAVITITSVNVGAQELMNEAPMEIKAERVSIEVANAYLKNCQNNFPRHFTPRAHQNFCNCSAASLRGEMTKDEYKSVREGKNNKPGNPAYEKYIKKVIVPCMTVATPDIAYVACLEDRGHNPYITSILQYCECVSDTMALHVERKGASSILKNSRSNSEVYKNPIYALLETGQYMTAKYDAQRECTQSAKKSTSSFPQYGR